MMDECHAKGRICPKANEKVLSSHVMRTQSCSKAEISRLPGQVFEVITKWRWSALEKPMNCGERLASC